MTATPTDSLPLTRWLNGPGGVVAPLIGDSRVSDASAGSAPLIDPATEEPIAEQKFASLEQVDHAVALATEAQREWWALAPARRGELLWRLSDALAAHAEELGALDALNIGKPLNDSVLGVRSCVEMLRYWAGKVGKIWGDTIPAAAGHLSYTERLPLGVVAAILPWNAPTQVVCGRLAPALACGNALIVKPSEVSPLSALRVAELALEVGIPVGLVAVLTGAAEAGERVATHPGIRGLVFIGSVENGTRVNVAAAASLKKVTMELGGKSPSIVFDDADLAAAAAGTAFGVFYNSGQACVASTRLLVQESIADEFVQQLTRIVEGLRVGAPATDPQLGPLATGAQYRRVIGYLETAASEGTQVAVGGGRPADAGNRGYYVAPTILTDVAPEMRVSREEIFGPVLSVLTFADEQEALALANSVQYGLSANIWTENVGRMLRLAEGLEVGIVWGNTALQIAPSLPFGGVKSSGFGNAYGEGAMEGYTTVKRTTIRFGARTATPAF